LNTTKKPWPIYIASHCDPALVMGIIEIILFFFNSRAFSAAFKCDFNMPRLSIKILQRRAAKNQTASGSKTHRAPSLRASTHFCFWLLAILTIVLLSRLKASSPFTVSAKHALFGIFSNAKS